MRRQEDATWWQGDREIAAEDVAYIRTFVKRFPWLSALKHNPITPATARFGVA